MTTKQRGGNNTSSMRASSLLVSPPKNSNSVTKTVSNSTTKTKTVNRSYANVVRGRQNTNTQSIQRTNAVEIDGNALVSKIDDDEIPIIFGHPDGVVPRAPKLKRRVGPQDGDDDGFFNSFSRDEESPQQTIEGANMRVYPLKMNEKQCIALRDDIFRTEEFGIIKSDRAILKTVIDAEFQKAVAQRIGRWLRPSEVKNMMPSKDRGGYDLYRATFLVVPSNPDEEPSVYITPPKDQRGSLTKLKFNARVTYFMKNRGELLNKITRDAGLMYIWFKYIPGLGATCQMWVFAKSPSTANKRFQDAKEMINDEAPLFRSNPFAKRQLKGLMLEESSQQIRKL